MPQLKRSQALASTRRRQARIEVRQLIHRPWGRALALRHASVATARPDAPLKRLACGIQQASGGFVTTARAHARTAGFCVEAAARRRGLHRACIGTVRPQTPEEGHVVVAPLGGLQRACLKAPGVRAIRHAVLIRPERGLRIGYPPHLTALALCAVVARNRRQLEPTLGGSGVEALHPAPTQPARGQHGVVGLPTGMRRRTRVRARLVVDGARGLTCAERCAFGVASTRFPGIAAVVVGTAGTLPGGDRDIPADHRALKRVPSISAGRDVPLRPRVRGRRKFL